MRTLKKVLALTIALATLFSLTAFAAYKDESAIASGTMSAVNLVNSLKIMTGDTKGNFNPTATITRAEAAKMVYVVRTSGNTSADGWKGQNVFTDTKGHWAEGFINYCASVGIIAGVGNGKFNPEGTLTGVELAKMLLVAAGYKADVQGYTGSAWQGKVLADAENAGLFNNYAPAYVGAAPRQYAAVMFANCLLRTNMAVYLSGELVNGAIGTQVLVGAKYFGLETKTGILNNVTATGFKLGTDSYTFKGAKADLAYQSTTVVYNKNTNEVYDVYASGKSKVYNVNFSDISMDDPSTGKYTIELPGYAETQYAGTDALNYVRTTRDNASDVNRVFASTMADLFDLVDNTTGNTAVRFIDQDGNGTLDLMIAFNDDYVKVSKNNTTDGFVVSNSAYNVSKDNYSKINFIDTVAKDDIVKMYRDMAGVMCVEKVEPFKAVVNSFVGAKYNLGGTNYYFADNAFSADDAAIRANGGKDVMVYTDGVNLVYVTAVSGAAVTEFSANVALLKDYYVAGSSLAGTNKAEVVLATGETKIFEYADITGNYAAADLTAGMKDNVFEYVLKDGKISFKKGTDLDPTAGVNYAGVVVPATNSGTSFGFAPASDSDLALTAGKVFTTGSLTMKTTDSSFFFVKYGTSPNFKYKVVKTSELAAFSAKTGYDIAYTTKNGVNTLAYGFVNLGTTLPEATSEANLLIVKSTAPTFKWDADAEDFVPQVSVRLFNGEDALLTVGADKVVSGSLTFTKGARYSYTVTGGVATLTAVASDSAIYDKTYFAGKTLDGFDATSILINGTFYTLADNAKIFYVKADGSLTTTDTALRTTLTVDFQLDKEVGGKVVTLIVTNYTPAS